LDPLLFGKVKGGFFPQKKTAGSLMPWKSGYLRRENRKGKDEISQRKGKGKIRKDDLLGLSRKSQILGLYQKARKRGKREKFADYVQGKKKAIGKGGPISRGQKSLPGQVWMDGRRTGLEEGGKKRTVGAKAEKTEIFCDHLTLVRLLVAESIQAANVKRRGKSCEGGIEFIEKNKVFDLFN